MVAVVWFQARPRSVQLFAASERVFGQLPEKKIDVRELFLLFCFFLFFILTEMLPTFVPFLATAYRIETFIWPCIFFHMLILDSRSTRRGLSVIICLSFIIFLPFLLSWWLCVVCLNRRILAESRGTTGRLPIWLINQSINPLVFLFFFFFPAMIYHANIFRISITSI